METELFENGIDRRNQFDKRVEEPIVESLLSSSPKLFDRNLVEVIH